jgi:hypothetical protein
MQNSIPEFNTPKVCLFIGARRMPFSVVNFLQDNSVEAIPCTWLEKRDDKVCIYHSEAN